MKHSINEIYKVHNPETNKTYYATKRHVEINEIFIAKRLRDIPDEKEWAQPVLYHVNNNKPMKVRDLYDIKLIWLYGEKVWFDTEKELVQYRAELAAEKELTKRRARALAEIMWQLESMGIEELERLAKTSLV